MSIATFGIEAGERYKDLLERSFQRLLERPAPPAAQGRDFAPRDVLFYHLRHVAAHQPRSTRVARPRHFIVYRSESEGILVLRLLHDAMDIETALSSDR